MCLYGMIKCPAMFEVWLSTLMFKNDTNTGEHTGIYDHYNTLLTRKFIEAVIIFKRNMSLNTKLLLLFFLHL